MKIGGVSASVPTVQTIEKSISGIVIVGTFESRKSISMLDSDLPVLIEDKFGGISLEVALVPKSGKTKYIYENIPLPVLFEKVAMDEGCICFSEDSTKDADNNIYSFRIYIPFAKTGALPLEQDEQIRLKWLNTSTTVFDTYQVESAIESDKFIIVQSHSMPQGQKNKVFDLSQSETVLIPRSAFTSGIKMQFNYSNGESPVLEVEELTAIGNHVNELLYKVGCRTAQGFGKYVQLDCSMIESLEVRRNTTTEFEIFLFDQEYHANLLRATLKNRKLRNTAKEHRVLRSVAAHGNLK